MQGHRRSGSVFSSKCGFATLFDPHGGRPASAGLGALSWNATFATKADAQAHGTAKDKEFKAMVAGGFMPCSVRELLDRRRRELAPQRDGGKWDFNRLLATEQRLDDMGLADLQLSAFKPRQMAAVRRARLGDRISPAGHARAHQCGRSRKSHPKCAGGRVADGHAKHLSQRQTARRRTFPVAPQPSNQS